MSCHPLPIATPENIYTRMLHLKLEFRNLRMVPNSILIVPESIGWMPFKKTEIASIGINSITAWRTSGSLVNSLLNPIWNIKMIAVKTTLIRMLVPVTTKTENLATFGLPAPSSLLTLTLQK